MSDPARLQRAAAFYSGKLSLPVFPLHPIREDGRCDCGGDKCAGKHPIPSRWQRTIASSASATRAVWRPELGPRGIGLACGERAGVWVLDVDVGSGGMDTIERLTATHGPLPRTWRARTGSGGRHLFWRMGDRVVTNSASSVDQGLDVRGEGGYVVMTPSPHRNGQEYEWLDPPTKAPLAVAPQWLTNLALMRPKTARVRRDREPLKMIAAGHRHDALIRFCGLLRSCGLGEDAIVECGRALLRYHAVQDPPMDMRQAERDMRDVARRYPPTAPRPT